MKEISKQKSPALIVHIIPEPLSPDSPNRINDLLIRVARRMLDRGQTPNLPQGRYSEIHLKNQREEPDAP